MSDAAKIGVFVRECGDQIAGFLDVPALTQMTNRMGGRSLRAKAMRPVYNSKGETQRSGSAVKQRKRRTGQGCVHSGRMA